MFTAPSPTRTALGGTAILMACACGAATNSAKLVALSGLGATTRAVHPIFVAIAAGLIITGLWRTMASAGRLALGAFGLLALAAAITPPTVMTQSAMPWSPVQLVGAGLYILAAGFLGYAFFNAFPSPKPSASAGAIGGAALATGCGCCMVTGAVAGMAATAGADPTFVQPSTVLHYTGLAMVAVGLVWLGGWRAAIWVPLAALLIDAGPKALKLTGDWLVAGVNLRFIPSYLITVAGGGVLMFGFATAHRLAAVRTREAPWAPAGREPSMGQALEG